MASKEKCIDVCNRLLRGEISAVETYDQALQKFSSEPASASLREIRNDHEMAAKTLRESVEKMGGSPASDSGAWGSIAQTVEGSAKLFGDKAALWALQQGEEIGEKDYEQALKSQDVMPEMKQMIENKLLPKQRKHLSQLQSLKQ